MSLWKRFTSGLQKTTAQLSAGIKSLGGQKIDEATLDELEDILIKADFGVHLACKLRINIERSGSKSGPDNSIRQILAQSIEQILLPAEIPLKIGNSLPHVILMTGVNGAGKTTSIAKITHQFLNEGKKVAWVAGDTFRSAATDQLQVWADRQNIFLHKGPSGCDAAGLVYDALQTAKAEGTDILIVDTAGRLPNKDTLMAELAKIKKVMAKLDESAPHDVILVLDATNGQNIYTQVDVFKQATGLTGLIITKLDGTAKGGIIAGITEKYTLPIYGLGMGEGIEDLHPFSAKAFAYNLLEIEEEA
jgi:fused signal recognition particle receptor